ncbi:MAG: family 10 glycosylhydrolase [Bacteroidaceae bacterium]|nr:family 10 glycosylhydrolase [Bacteroidaceae bacterium]
MMNMKHFQHILLLIIASLIALPSMGQGDVMQMSPLIQSEPLKATDREVRAVWLTTYLGLDWPRTRAKDAAGVKRQKEDLCKILDELKAAGTNIVLFQARTRSATTYASAYEPWDEIFTGRAGEYPGYDPMAFAVQECHRRGMEIHAWVVSFPICHVPTAKRLAGRALPAIHPELCQKCGDVWMMDPGVPGTDKYLAKICREIVDKYDVDGIHLDYIRYPESAISFSDKRTYAKYGAGQSKSTWRRDNVTRCVREISNAVKSSKPWVKMSCSPVGKYADLPRQSSKGWNARDAVSQDAILWLNEGLMDMLFPMMYFDGQHFYPFAADWQERAGGKPVVPGLGIYFLNDRERGWSLDVIRRQMYYTRLVGNGGQAYFRSKFFTDNEKGLYDFTKEDFWRDEVLPPAIDGAEVMPSTPQGMQIIRQGCTIDMSWEQVRSPYADRPTTYNIYACPTDTFSASSAKRIATKLTQTKFSYQPTLPSALNQSFYVTAIDAFGNESTPAPFLQQTSDYGGNYYYTDGQVAVPHIEGIANLALYDITGRKVKQMTPGKDIDISNVSAGAYLLRGVKKNKAEILLLRIWRK